MNIVFRDYRNKRPRECPKNLWQQRNQETHTQLARYNAGGRRRRLQEAEKETGQLFPAKKEQASCEIHV